ncbi:MAG: flagellar protein FlgN [Oscillospiraceae bacterium]|nr:flagellar protein FlgN [Oscillospiraceae bacterium]
MSRFHEAARLRELLDMEAEVSAGMLELLKQQTRLLEAGDAEELNKSLVESARLMGKFDGLHQETEPLMQSYILYLGSDGAKEDKQLEAAWQRVTELLGECSELNKKNVAEAKEGVQEYVRRIGSLSMKRESLGRYAQPTGDNSAMFDKKQ